MKQTGFLFFISIMLMACGDESSNPIPDGNNSDHDTEATSEFAAVITLLNDGASAYIVTNIDGPATIAALNAQNSDIRLEIGNRYKFINAAGVNHPLDFRDAEGNYLLTQDTINGEFEEDEAVNWIFNYGEGSVAFTLKASLADRIATYNCTIHAAMTGSIITQ